MKDQDKTKEQLIEELCELRQTVNRIKTNEAACIERESQFRDMLGRANQGIFIIQDGVIKFENQACLDITGYSFGDWSSSYVIEALVHPDDIAMVQKYYQGRQRGEETPDYYDFRLVCKDGSTKWVEMKGAVGSWEGRPANLGIMTDITDRKKAAEALKDSNRQLRESQRIARMGAWEWDVITGKTSWSDETYRIFGLEPGEAQPSYELAMKFTHPDDRILWENAVRKALVTENLFRLDYRSVRTDGAVIWIHNEAEVVRDESGNPLRLLGTAQDMTDAKLAELALKESEDRYRTIVDRSPTGIAIVNDSYKYEFVNDEFCRIAGYEKKELLGSDFFLPLAEESRNLAIERYLKRQKGEPVPDRYKNLNLFVKMRNAEQAKSSPAFTRIGPAGSIPLSRCLTSLNEKKRMKRCVRVRQCTGPFSIMRA